MQRRLLWLVEVVPLVVLAGCSTGGSGEPTEPNAPDASVDVNVQPAVDANAGPVEAGAINPGPSCPNPFTMTFDAGIDAGDSGLLQQGECKALCASAPYLDAGWPTCSCVYGASHEVIVCESCCVGGRRPAGFASDGVRARSALGAHFAQMAQLEAASVDAFRILKRELVAHRAPRALVHAAERAARDEARHARATAALAKRFGGEVSPRRVARDRDARSLEAIALENVREGCVRETYGAMEAAYAARAAGDPVVRAVTKRLARDEARHASLAWSVDAWARAKLGKRARGAIDDERARAIDELRRELAASRPTIVHDRAGIPMRDAARAMVAAIG